MKRPIAVVQGSLNCDIIVRGCTLPIVGQTLLGTEHAVFSGGKGANQAVQLAKLGADVYLIGRVGRDSYGDFLLQELEKAGVRTDFIRREDDATGIGSVQCDAAGQYYAMVIPNANGKCVAKDVLTARDVIAKADVMMCQLETTDEAMLQAASLAQEYDVPLIVNPAPAKRVEKSLFGMAHTLTPNETETAFFTGIDVDALASQEGWEHAADQLLANGAKRVLMTLGEKGSYYADQSHRYYTNALPVSAVDTTAAGDAFNGAYAYAVACGFPIEKCLLYANAAGALATQKSGAQSSMCDIAELENFLGEIA